MAFPTVAATITTEASSSGGSVTLNLPTGIVNGSRLYMVATHRGSRTWSAPSGWTLQDQGEGGNQTLALFYRDSDGSDGSTQAFSVTGGDESVISFCWRIADHDSIVPAFAVNTPGASTTTPDPPSLNPSAWDVEDTLWLAVTTHFGSDVTAFPLPDNQLDITLGGTITLGICSDDLAQATLDPSTFTIASSELPRTATIAIKGLGVVAGAVILPGPGFRLKGPRGFIKPWLGVSASEVVLEVTGTVSETQDDQTAAAAGWIEITGTVAETQDAQTSTATGVLGYSGTLAETQDNQTSTATGVLGYTGTLAETQDNQTSSASGTVGGAGEITGTLAETQADQISTATGQLGYTGTLARTQADQTSAAAGWIEITGTLAETQSSQTVAAAGQLGYAGTLAEIQVADTGTAAGWIEITGLVARTQTNQVCDATGFFGELPIPSGIPLTVEAGASAVTVRVPHPAVVTDSGHAVTVDRGTHDVEVE